METVVVAGKAKKFWTILFEDWQRAEKPGQSRYGRLNFGLPKERSYTKAKVKKHW